MWPFTKKLILTAELREDKIEAHLQAKGMVFWQWTEVIPPKETLARQMMLAMMMEMYHMIGPYGWNRCSAR